MTNESPDTTSAPPLDVLLAASISRAVSTHLCEDNIMDNIDPAATWGLCEVLAEHGLAVSESTGVSTRRIGPFRLAIREDSPRDLQTLVLSLIPIAVTVCRTGGVTEIAGYVAALSFAFKVLSTTLVSGCLVSDEREWQVLLAIKQFNDEDPPIYPNAGEIEGFISRAVPGGEKTSRQKVVAALASLCEKEPIWGSKPTALVLRGPGERFQALA